MNRTALCLAALLALPFASHAQTAPPNIINFQGRIATPSGNPVADGTYSIRFSLWDASSAGTEKWNQTVANVAVKNGTFAVPLSGFFATVFDGNVWLETKIGTSAPLAPRIQLVSIPYALKSNLALTVPDGSITTAKFASGVLNAAAWLLGGNSGTTTSHFLGTIDNSPLELRVNNHRVMRYQYVQGSVSVGTNVLGGSEVNQIGAGVMGATIAGGGLDGITGGDELNRVLGDGGTVSGGSANTAGSGFATVGGGRSNTVNGSYATIGGGSYNAANGTYSIVSAGFGNTASGIESTIGGGSDNTASFTGSTVGGGRQNTAAGFASTVPGGYQNAANWNGCFAAGYRAKAVHDGAFVWADYYASDFYSSRPNSFNVRASGGIVVECSGDLGLFTGTGSSELNRYMNLLNSPGFTSASGLKAGGILCSDSFGYANPGKNDLVVKGGISIGGAYAHDVYKLVVNGSVYSFGSYLGSDARWKTNVLPLDNALDSVLRLRGVSYEWDKAKFPNQNFSDGKQMGFLAQEVEKIFPHLVMTAPDGYKAVNYVGMVPVLAEAVKAQQKQINAKDARISALETKLDAVLKRLDALENTRK